MKINNINYYYGSHTGIGLLPRLQADSLSDLFSSCDAGKGKDKDGGKDGGKDRGKGRVSCQFTY